MSIQTTRIVLAEDHSMVRQGIAALLSCVPGIEVVAQTRTGRELLDCTERMRPDIVLTDISMPEMDGIEACAAIRERFPQVKVLVLSMYESPDTIRRALASGACGYLLKNSSEREFEDAILSVRATGSWRSKRVAEILAREDDPRELLTPRQVEILRRMAQGASSKEIAHELGLSSKTVDVHRMRLMQRLEIRDVAGLTRYALRNGLV